MAEELGAVPSVMDELMGRAAEERKPGKTGE